MKGKLFPITLLVLLLLSGFILPALAQSPDADKQAPAGPENIKIIDFPGDKGQKITLTWGKSPDDKELPGGQNKVKAYYILRSVNKDGPYNTIKELAPGKEEFINDVNVVDRLPYYYKIKTVDKNGLETISEAYGPVQASPQYFNTNFITLFIGVVLYISIVIIYIRLARRKKDMFVRKIAGLDAVDEAIGRATEMGKPILYLTGLDGIASISTIASITILGRVAKKVAEYETPLIVPCVDPIVMIVAREVVKESFTEAGKPDAYKDDYVFFLSDAQFPYAAGVDGIMIREKPAANFYLGYFYAESLILAETGAATGAIQIAGTDALTQIPFFITACDYTLIGEELYAASAYLSHEPLLLGALKAQDMGKLIIGALIIIGIICQTAGLFDFASIFKLID